MFKSAVHIINPFKVPIDANRPTAVQILHRSAYFSNELNEHVISSGSWRCLESIKDERVEAITGGFVRKWFRCLLLLKHLFQDAFVWFQLFSLTLQFHMAVCPLDTVPCLLHVVHLV